MKPKTSVEKYLAKISGEEVSLPKPRTVAEQYLSEIAKNGAVSNGGANNVIDFASLTAPTYMDEGEEDTVDVFVAYVCIDGQVGEAVEFPNNATLLIGDVGNICPSVLKFFDERHNFTTFEYEYGRSSFEIQTPEEDENGSEAVCLLNTEPIMVTAVNFTDHRIFFIPSSARFGLKKITFEPPDHS